LKPKFIPVKVFTFCILLLQFNITSKAQKTEDDRITKQKFGLEYKSYAIGNGTEAGPFRKGLNVFYSWKIAGNTRHQIYISPQIGYLADPGIQTRLLQTVSLDYNLNVTKRLELVAFFGFGHILTKLNFDRYEYNQNGDFENKGKFHGQLSPSYGGRIGWKLFKRANYSITPYVGLSSIKIDRSYNGTIKGFKGATSVGLTFNF
jgi:hypothetical protein